MNHFQIFPYRDWMFKEICGWWINQGEIPPVHGMMVEDGTFVVQYRDEIVMTLTAFKTQSKDVAYCHGYCAKPGLQKQVRNTIGKLLWEHCFEYLRKNGFKRSVSFSAVPALIKRYENLGMKPGLHGLTSLIKEF